MAIHSLLYLSFFLLGMPFFILAQDHTHGDKHHSHNRNEVAISNNLVFLGMDKEFSYGVHLHYIRNIGATKFGSGLGYERIFDEHGHNTISIAGSYRPFHEFALMISPGITFEDHWENHFDFSIHLEAGYEIEINHCHLGPVLALALIPGDYHVSIGLHLGYIF